MKKWLLGGLGWALLGPIGGIIGFLLGSAIDKPKNVLEDGRRNRSDYRRNTYTSTNRHNFDYERSNTQNKQNYAYGIPTQLGDFMVSMLIFISEIIRADGKILKSELDYVKSYFKQKFGLEKTKEALRVLKILLQKEIPLYQVSRQIKQNLDYHSRLQLLHFLFGLADADGEIHPFELQKIEVIYKAMGISEHDFRSVKAMFIEEEMSPYEILQIPASANVEEIKTAFRKLAKEFHPDRVAYLGEEVQSAAKEKFQKINQAYDKLKKRKGFV